MQALGHKLRLFGKSTGTQPTQQAMATASGTLIGLLDAVGLGWDTVPLPVRKLTAQNTGVWLVAVGQQYTLMGGCVCGGQVLKPTAPLTVAVRKNSWQS